MSERTVKLWLDDVRKPWEHGIVGYDWVLTAADAIEALKTGSVEFASLDHDLAEEHYPWNCASIEDTVGTGYDVVCFLEQNPEYLPPDGIAVHSLNPVGRERMLVVVRRLYGRDFQHRAADVTKRPGG